MPRLNPIFDQLTTYPQQALNERKAQVKLAEKKSMILELEIPSSQHLNLFDKHFVMLLNHTVDIPK